MKKRREDITAQTLLAYDLEQRNNTQALDNLYRTKKAIAQSGESLEDKKRKASDLKNQITKQEHITQESSQRLKNALLHTPNLLHSDTPDGTSEEDNLEVCRHGSIPSFDFKPKHHSEFQHLGLDDAAGAALSGTRFSVLRGPIALLQNALERFMIDKQLANGYELISTPFLVKEQALHNTGQLPKFRDDLFYTQTDHWLIPTAEVTLTSLVAQSIIKAEDLPLRLMAITSCFRKEAGAAGRQTKGLIRQHQFTKIELVHITQEGHGSQELEILTNNAESILKSLDLPFKKILLCAGDIGFSAMKTYDLEVWMPSQNAYCEVSSCSLCGTFQAQRMKARYRVGDVKIPVTTLNGSGLAVGRTLAAIIENYQTKEGRITVPTVLRPYVNNAEIL